MVYIFFQSPKIVPNLLECPFKIPSPTPSIALTTFRLPLLIWKLRMVFSFFFLSFLFFVFCLFFCLFVCFFLFFFFANTFSCLLETLTCLYIVSNIFVSKLFIEFVYKLNLWHIMIQSVPELHGCQCFSSGLCWSYTKVSCFINRSLSKIHRIC